MTSPDSSKRAQNTTFNSFFGMSKSYATVSKTVFATRILNLLFLVAVFVINGLASGSTLTGKPTGEVSDNNQSLIVPAGYAFSIWGLIYFFLAVFGIYQMFPQTLDSRPINEGVGFMLILNACANITWIFVWGYGYVTAAAVIIFLVAIPLAVIYTRLSIKFFPAATWLEYLCLHVPFSLYFAWLIAASIVNVYSAATTTDEKYIPAAVAGLVVGFLLEGGTASARRDPWISGVGAWALGAIAVKQSAVQPVYLTASILAVVLGALTVSLAIFNTVIYFQGKVQPWDSSENLTRLASNENLESPGTEVSELN
jgi:hypothetical protein